MDHIVCCLSLAVAAAIVRRMENTEHWFFCPPWRFVTKYRVEPTVHASLNTIDAPGGQEKSLLEPHLPELLQITTEQIRRHIGCLSLSVSLSAASKLQLYRWRKHPLLGVRNERDMSNKIERVSRHSNYITTKCQQTERDWKRIDRMSTLFEFTCRACLERKVHTDVHSLVVPENRKIYLEVTQLWVSVCVCVCVTPKFLTFPFPGLLILNIPFAGDW